MNHRHANIAAIVLCIMQLVLCFTACQPDTTCRQDIDIQCNILAQDSAKTQLYKVRIPLLVDTTQTDIQLLCPIDSSVVVLSVQYTNRVDFVSNACGCMVRHKIDSIWTDHPELVVATRVNDIVPAGKDNNILLTFLYRRE